MGSDHSTLFAIVVFMSAAVIMVPLFKRFGLGTVLGYLAAGMLVGPWGLAVVEEVDEIRHFSEYGVVFLLFIIGLELHPRKLWDMRSAVFGLGSAQIVLTALLTGLYMGYRGQSWESVFLLGAGIAMSSTAIVLQTMNERAEFHSNAGRAAFSILLMQDIAVVPLLAAVPLLGGGAVMATPDPLWSILSIIAIVVVTRYGLIPLMGMIASVRNHEIFATTAVLAVLAAALAMEVNHLSMGLGAFLVGLTLSDCQYRHQIEADVAPFKGYLLGLFFMAIGMTLDFAVVYHNFGKIVLNLLGLFTLKGIILFGLGKLWRYSTRESLRLSFLLPQCGEFGFVLFGVMLLSGLIDQATFQGFLVFVALTMVISPFWEKIGDWLIAKFPEREDVTGLDQMLVDEEKPKALIVGFGRFGQRIAQMMADLGVNFVAVEIKPALVRQGRASGYNVIYGDATRPDFLQSLDIECDCVVVLTMEGLESAKKIIKVLRGHHPAIDILARAHTISARSELLDLDVTEAVPESLEASLKLGEIALWRVGADFDRIADVIRQARTEGYAVPASKAP